MMILENSLPRDSTVMLAIRNVFSRRRFTDRPQVCRDMGLRAIVFALFFLYALPALSAIVTVNTAKDVSDFSGAQQISDLPGPDGLVSFREALTAVNNTPDSQRIEFSIPEDQFDSPGMLDLESGTFIIDRDGVAIDFLTQGGFSVVPPLLPPVLGIRGLEPNGSGQPALAIRASNVVVRGLGAVNGRAASVAVWSGENNRFVGNRTTAIEIDPLFGQTVSGTIIGGTTPSDANDLDFVGMNCGANDTVVTGNRITRISIFGSASCGEGTGFPSNNRIGGPSEAERNVINGFGGYNGQGRPSGEGIDVFRAANTLIEGNYIGVASDGQTPAGQAGTVGVQVVDSVDTLIRDNLISGIRAPGIGGFAGQVFGTAIQIVALNEDVEGVFVESNLVGTDATGSTPIPNWSGVEVLATGSRVVSMVRIGVEPGSGGNVNAHADTTGIVVSSNTTTGVDITGNRIHSNGGLGIDLGGDGVTANDFLDQDSGPNSLQNFPVLSAAVVNGNELAVAGTLASEPQRSYRIEFFASSQANASGHGEGALPLGSTLVTTNAQGDASFDIVLPPSLSLPGWVLAATATDQLRGETSEFGLALAIEADSDHVFATRFE